jgi:hypothetical protein
MSGTFGIDFADEIRIPRWSILDSEVIGGLSLTVHTERTVDTSRAQLRRFSKPEEGFWPAGGCSMYYTV